MLIPDPSNPGGWIEETDNRHPGNTVVGHDIGPDTTSLPDVTTQLIGSVRAIGTGSTRRSYMAISTVDPKIADTWVPWGAGDMRWLSAWASGGYEKGDVVRDDGWTMICTLDGGCDERPSPQPVGDPFDIYAGASPTTQQLGSQVVFGNKYTMTVSGYLNSWRLYTVVGNLYRAFLVEYPAGQDPVLTEIISFEATGDGWGRLPIDQTVVPAGTVFAIIVTVSEPDPSPTVWTGNWNYDTPNNANVPLAGQIVHANQSTDTLRIHYFDNDGGDRTAEVQALTVGDIIEANGTRWSIQSNVDSTTYAIFGISPSVQTSPDGVTAFSFETVTPTPITYLNDPGYWPTSQYPTVVGLFGLDTENIVEDTNAYGVDIELQQALVSTQWEVVAVPGGGGGGDDGGGGTPEIPSTLVTDRLRLNATDDASLISTQHALQIGPDTGQHMVMDGNEIIVRNPIGTGAQMYLQSDEEAGGLTVFGSDNVNSTATFYGWMLAAQRIRIDAGSDVVPGTSADVPFMIGTPGGSNLQMDENEIMWKAGLAGDQHLTLFATQIQQPQGNLTIEPATDLILDVNQIMVDARSNDSIEIRSTLGRPYISFYRGATGADRAGFVGYPVDAAESAIYLSSDTGNIILNQASSKQILINGNGGTATPAIAAQDDADTGMFWALSGDLRMTSSGVLALQMKYNMTNGMYRMWGLGTNNFQGNNAHLCLYPRSSASEVMGGISGLLWFTNYSTDRHVYARVFQAEGDRLGLRNYENTAWVPISASAFTVGSSIREKKGVRTAREEGGLLDFAVAGQRSMAFERYRLLRPVFFDDKEQHHDSRWQGCLYHDTRLECSEAGCDEQNDMYRTAHDCRTSECEADGVTGVCQSVAEHINKVGLVVEEVAEVYPLHVAKYVNDSELDGVEVGKPFAYDINGLHMETINVVQHLLDEVAELRALLEARS